MTSALAHNRGFWRIVLDGLMGPENAFAQYRKKKLMDEVGVIMQPSSGFAGRNSDTDIDVVQVPTFNDDACTSAAINESAVQQAAEELDAKAASPARPTVFINQAALKEFLLKCLLAGYVEAHHEEMRGKLSDQRQRQKHLIITLRPSELAKNFQ